MKKYLVFFLLIMSFGLTSLFADQWDGFFKATIQFGEKYHNLQIEKLAK